MGSGGITLHRRYWVPKLWLPKSRGNGVNGFERQVGIGV